ncbi:MAG: MFS transporter, partial [Actinobacteria bacterium]|nr:MFS transporter [Actinomycetota bacterium]
GLSAVVAIAAVGVGFAAEAPPRLGWGLAALCIVGIGVAIRPLLPAGTLRVRAGLPSVILIRGLLAGAFFAAEAFIPKLLIEQFDFRPTTAGLALTLAALGWSFASFMQGRYGDRIGNAPIVIVSISLLLLGVALLMAIAALNALPWLVMFAWGIAGCGMGFLYPRLSVLTLAYSNPSNEGFNSAALSISDSAGSAITIAMVGLAFLTAPLAGSGFTVVFGISALVLLACLFPGLRLGSADSAQRVPGSGV